MPKTADAAVTTGRSFFEGLPKSVAQRLMASGFKVNALRSLDLLRKDEWIELDRTVVDIARVRLVGVNDLVSRGLVYNVPNGLGATVLQYEDASDMEDAEIAMDPISRGRNDRVEFDIKSMPLPVTFKDFQVSLRFLETSRRNGMPIDTTQAAIAATKVAEKVETGLFQGFSSYKFAGGTLYGYVDHPNRNTVSLGTAWSSDTGANILTDVLNMIQASINDRHYGPWGLYIPTAYQTKMEDDFKAESSDTIRERILAIDGIEFLRVADKLSANNVVLVELRQETARMVVGLQPTTVEWETEGGMLQHFKVMAILVPQLRADQDGRMGLVHLS